MSDWWFWSRKIQSQITSKLTWKYFITCILNYCSINCNQSGDEENLFMWEIQCAWQSYLSQLSILGNRKYWWFSSVCFLLIPLTSTSKREVFYSLHLIPITSSVLLLEYLLIYWSIKSLPCRVISKINNV